MPIHRCVEPAQANANDHPIVVAPAGDGILFPSVDSCFAICLSLDDGTLLGGHVPVFFDDAAFHVAMGLGAYNTGKGTANYDMQEDAMEWSLGKIIDEMNTRRGGTIARAAVTLGDSQWRPLWDKLRGKFGYAVRQIRYEKGAGARNLIVNTADNSVRVQRQIGGHYLNQFAHQRTIGQGTINAQPIQI